LGVKYSVFVNSGSSANLAIMYALKISKRLKNLKVVVPCISWVTTVSPLMQLGFEPILCDAERDTLGVDIDELEDLFISHNPSCLIIVHVLAFPNKMDRIIELCDKYNVILIEDSCESVGSKFGEVKTGCFGLMSSFSTYFGHHFSTIEGGIISTDDFEMYEILKAIRSHGWSRDLSPESVSRLKNEYQLDDFKNLYSFFYPGFNLRATDLQAFIGLGQLQTLDEKVNLRNRNLSIYNDLIINPYWKISSSNFVSCFAYPIIHPRKNEIVSDLQFHLVETRPLICGSISKQPFYYTIYGKSDFEMADIVHDLGLYLPNNPDMEVEEIKFICDIVNIYTNSKI
jgi:CDP-6-deoxy-D-xylo-4-hexulose-3-dehydrase